VKVGVQLPEVERHVRWAELADMARVAEDAGFDSLWVGDHLLYDFPDGTRRGPWEAWTVLAALAAVTDRVELGPFVAATSFHNPAMLAKKAATLDEISGGRLILGLGAGWNRTEYEAFGFPYDHRVSRFEEAFNIVRRLLAGEEVTFSGAYYRVDGCLIDPPGPRPGGIPLLVGSLSPRMLRITLPHVASWNAWYEDYGNDTDRLPGLFAPVRAACAEVGRDPATVEATVAMYVLFDEQPGRRNPSRGILPERLGEALVAAARHGIGHVQLVLDPITAASIEQVAPALGSLAAAGHR
jgi:probable F420-dependent oxidoreductase